MKTRFLATIILSLTIFLALPRCTSNTTSNSHSDKIYTDISSTTTKQTNSTSDSGKQKYDLTKIYSQAIGDYIKLANKEYKLTFDTLFFGKHIYGQPDDFPEIELPLIIENTNIKLISPEEGEKKQMNDRSSFYINLIGWVNPDNTDFIFVTFSNGFAHQFDCFIKYKYNTDKKEFFIKTSRFENYLYQPK